MRIGSRTHALSASALALCMLTVGCKRDSDAMRDSTNVAMAPTTVSDSAAGVLNGAMTDGQIIQAAMTANSLDSAGGVGALAKLKKDANRKFAQSMVKDHGMLNDSLRALSSRLTITPAPNPISDALQRDASNTASALGSAPDYDRAYIENEIMMHRSVLRTIDEQLIPQAQNASLKALLQMARGAVAGHLERAQHISTVASR